MSSNETAARPLRASALPRGADVIMAVSVIAYVVGNLCAVKLVTFTNVFGTNLYTDGGALLFPVTYIVSDILTEVYGYRYARRVMWTSIVALGVSLLALQFVIALPADAEWPLQDAMASIYGTTIRIFIASVVAFFAGDILNALVLSKMKVRRRGGSGAMASRFFVSTIVGETVDTTLFSFIAFSGVFAVFGIPGYQDVPTTLKFILIGIVWKCLIETVGLVVSVPLATALKRRVGEADDAGISYNPFRLKVDA